MFVYQKNIGATKRTNTSSEQEMLRRDNIPEPIPQSKINHPKSGLLKIPLFKGVQHVKDLFLPYNNISSSQGLSHYKSLTNLNLSHNRLTDIQELIRSLIPLQNIKRISIRKNQFMYGYEDQIIMHLLHKLKRIDDTELPELNKKKQIFVIRDKISRIMLPGIERMRDKVSEFDERKEVGDRDFMIVAELSKFYKNKRRAHVAEDKLTQLEKIYTILHLFLCFQLMNPSCSQDRHMTIFQETLKQILLKFQMRNNYELINSLKRENLPVQLSSCNFSQIVMNFGHLLDAYIYEINSLEHPGKYLQKIDPESVSNHQFYQYLQRGQNRQKLNTLVPELRTKNQLLEPKKAIKQKKASFYFGRFPIVVYERNYLQIIEEILIEKIGEIMRIFDKIAQQRNNIMVKKDEDKKIVEQMSRSEKTPESELSKLSNIVKISEIVEKNWENEEMVKDDQKSHNLGQKQSRKTVKRGHRKETMNKQNNDNSNTDRVYQMEEKKQEKIVKNLNKYSLYQINLAYKVLFALKINKNWHKRQKNPHQQSDYLLFS